LSVSSWQVLTINRVDGFRLLQLYQASRRTVIYRRAFFINSRQTGVVIISTKKSKTIDEQIAEEFQDLDPDERAEVITFVRTIKEARTNDKKLCVCLQYIGDNGKCPVHG